MSQPAAPPQAPASTHAWWPYVAPMVAFLVLGSLEGYLPSRDGGPHPAYYPLAYAAKMAVLTALMVAGRVAWRDLSPRPGTRAVALAALVGVAVTVGWVLLERIGYPKPRFISGDRPAFNPTSLRGAARIGFLAVRLYGLVLVVPLMEELFWRSFLMRVIIDPDADFRRVPVGRVTLPAAAITSALFAAAHPEWLPALLTGLAWAWLLHFTRSLGACVISHAVANLGLGLYILATGHWELW